MIRICKVLFATGCSFCLINADAQTGNVGIGTANPGSKLTVNGSFAATYNGITATSYAVGENDFYVVWNGTAAGTITLLPGSASPNRTGRLYFFKNTSTVYSLTIDANGTELIDSEQTVLLQPGESVLLVKTNNNTTTGTTWEVVQFSSTQRYASSFVGGSATYDEGVTYTHDYSSIEYSSNGGADMNLTTNAWTCPQSGIYKIEVFEMASIPYTGTTRTTHVSIHIMKNGTVVAAGLYNLISAAMPSALAIGNSGRATIILNLAKGDIITSQGQSCIGCGVATVTPIQRRMSIQRL